MRKICPACSSAFTDSAIFRCPHDGAALIVDDDTDMSLGTVLDERYEVQRRIGRGGMGTVYLGRQVAIGRPVAIKVLGRLASLDHERVRRFYREARAAASLDSPHIITVYDFGRTADERLYLVMEYIDGPSLADVLAELGRLPFERAIPICVQICDALAAAHRQGVVHRDLKPGNVMLQQKPDASDFVKVLDFGIAKTNDPSDDEKLTQTGSVCGTPAYISPEVARGRRATASSDLYALGALLYELLTGQPLFAGETALEVVYKHAADPPPRLRAIPACATLPATLEAFLLRVLDKSPENRPADATAFKHELVRAASGESPAEAAGAASAVPLGPVEPTRVGPTAALVAEQRASRQNLSPSVVPPAPAAPAAANGGGALPTGASAALTDPRLAEPEAPRRRRAPLLALGALAFVAAVVAAFLVFGLGGGPPAEDAAPALTGTAADAAAPARPPGSPADAAAADPAPAAVAREAGTADSNPAAAPAADAGGGLAGPETRRPDAPGAVADASASPGPTDARADGARPAAAAAAADLVRVAIRTTPAGVRVFVAGKLVGTTPLHHDFAPAAGPVAVELRKAGYRSEVVQFVPAPGSVIERTLTARRQGDPRRPPDDFGLRSF